jgi:hypothetical protein
MRRMRARLAFAAPIAALIAVTGLAVNGPAQAENGNAHAAIKAPVRAGAPEARAQAVPDVEYSCSGNIYTPFRQCYFQTQNGHAPLFAPNGSLHELLPLNDKVLVTCYYFGNPPAPYLGDGVEDHVTWENTVGNFTGHIPDPYIDEGNELPSDYPYDLDECG